MRERASVYPQSPASDFREKSKTPAPFSPDAHPIASPPQSPALPVEIAGYQQVRASRFRLRTEREAREVRVPVEELRQLADEYLMDCEYQAQARSTQVTRRNFLLHFFWFLKHRGFTECGATEIKQFLHYTAQSHEDDGGRWGNPKMTKAVRPITLKDYYICLRAFFQWMVDEELVDSSPMRRVPRPTFRSDLKQPLSAEQVTALLAAAKSSPTPTRDTAVLLFLLDTGVRASELCGLRMKDADLEGRRALIHGKGNKFRTCYWGINTAKALTRYLRKQARRADEPLFISDRGTRAGEALTPSGLYQLVSGLGKTVGVKCGCHDFRRTFAVNILKNGANLISVQRLMGHETISITQGYLNIAQTDIEEQHRQFSPADRLKIR
jgi:site-specific recombinase XerD